MNIATLSTIFTSRRDREARSATISARIGGWLQKLHTRIERERDFRDAIDHLESMSDAQLRDIGITRSDIGNAVRFGRHYYLER